mmetsp:Transcript_22378/g.57062  ORF Transcript_22378/g.57062 Transcript_22378/m.57062 type:complete len:276 (-) Transcript_22378:31-858(-)
MPLRAPALGDPGPPGKVPGSRPAPLGGPPAPALPAEDDRFFQPGAPDLPAGAGDGATVRGIPEVQGHHHRGLPVPPGRGGRPPRPGLPGVLPGRPQLHRRLRPEEGRCEHRGGSGAAGVAAGDGYERAGGEGAGGPPVPVGPGGGLDPGGLQGPAPGVPVLHPVGDQADAPPGSGERSGGHPGEGGEDEPGARQGLLPVEGVLPEGADLPARFLRPGKRPHAPERRRGQLGVLRPRRHGGDGGVAAVAAGGEAAAATFRGVLRGANPSRGPAVGL